MGPQGHTDSRDSQPRESQPRDSQPREPQSREPQQVDLNPPPGGEPRAADGIRAVRRIFQSAPNPPRFPMYVRQAKQFMRGIDPQFDERKYGFGTLQDLLRACQREGLFRIERDRQGVIRLFPGNIMQPSTGADDPDDDLQPETVAAPAAASAQGWARERDDEGHEEEEDEDRGDERPADRGATPADEQRATDAYEARTEVVDGDVVRETEEQPVVDGEEAAPAGQPKKGRGTRKRAAAPRTARKTEKSEKAAAAPRARKAAGASRARAPRARKTPSE
jgi:hypothetical protein